MLIPNEMMNEKQPLDVETANNGPDSPDILNPLRFLLATRRGTRTDSHVAEIPVPDDYAIMYVGKSGVEAIKKFSGLKRFFCHCGIMSGKWTLCFMVFNLIQIIGSFRDRRTDKEEARKNVWSDLITGCIVSGIVYIFLMACKSYARRQEAAATPPQYDPSSYQYRLVAAMEQKGMQHRDIVTATLGELEKQRSSRKGLCERFRIEGLVDPEDNRWVYDIIVMFFSNATVRFEFAPTGDEATKTDSGVVMGTKQSS